MFYIDPEKNLHAYPRTFLDTNEWKAIYKIRRNIEKSIQHFKNSFYIARRKTQNKQTLHTDLLFAGIHQHQYIHSLKPLIE